LPTYSPELNPCEMVFGFVKNSLRISRNSNNAFFDEVNERFHQITTQSDRRARLFESSKSRQLSLPLLLRTAVSEQQANKVGMRVCHAG
jgi:hypothetical protein